MPKHLEDVKIAILTCPFEPPKPKTKHKVRPGWAGLGWAGPGRAGLGWAVGLSWLLGWAGLAAVLSWQLGWAELAAVLSWQPC